MSKLSSIEELFAGRHFDREVIILCVRWYLRYKLSFRDLVEMMAERGLSLPHNFACSPRNWTAASLHSGAGTFPLPHALDCDRGAGGFRRRADVAHLTGEK